MRSGKLTTIFVVLNCLTLLSLTLCVATIVSWIGAGSGARRSEVVIGPVELGIAPWLFVLLTALLPVWRVGLVILDWHKARTSVWICEKCGRDLPLRVERCPCQEKPIKLEPPAGRQEDAGRPLLRTRRAS